MEFINVTCECGKVLKVRMEALGKRVRCPSCGAVILVDRPVGHPTMAISLGGGSGTPSGGTPVVPEDNVSGYLPVKKTSTSILDSPTSHHSASVSVPEQGQHLPPQTPSSVSVITPLIRTVVAVLVSLAVGGVAGFFLKSSAQFESQSDLGDSTQLEALRKRTSELEDEVSRLEDENKVLKETDQSYFLRARDLESNGQLEEAMAVLEEIPKRFPSSDLLPKAKERSDELRDYLEIGAGVLAAAVERAATERAMENAKSDVLVLVKEELDAQLAGSSCAKCWVSNPGGRLSFKRLLSYQATGTFTCGKYKRVMGVIVKTRGENSYGASLWGQTEFLAGLEGGAWKLAYAGEAEKGMDLCVIAGLSGLLKRFEEPATD